MLRTALEIHFLTNRESRMKLFFLFDYSPVNQRFDDHWNHAEPNTCEW